MSSTVPSSKTWQTAVIILLHKKGNTSDIKNYRPISLLPIINKVFSHILLQWILWTLTSLKSRLASDQASQCLAIFISSTNSKKKHTSTASHCALHSQTMRKLLSIKFEPIFQALENHGVDKAYLDIIKHPYCKAMSVICLHTDSEKFRLQRGVRQGDNISPRLFTSCLQDAIIGKIHWKDRGIKIDGEYLSHLIFANHIVLIAELTSELQKMLQDIHENQQTNRSQYAPGKD